MLQVCYNILCAWYIKKNVVYKVVHKAVYKVCRERYNLSDIAKEKAGKNTGKNTGKAKSTGSVKKSVKSINSVSAGSVGRDKDSAGFGKARDRHGKKFIQRGLRIKGESVGKGKCVKFTPNQLLTAFYKYKKECEKSDNVMTINGFGLSAGFNKDTLLSYRREHKGYEDALAVIDAEMLENVVQRGYQMRNPAFAIFHLKNSFGWKDREDTNVNVVNVIQQMDSDDRRARIRELLRQKESFMQITGSGGSGGAVSSGSVKGSGDSEDVNTIDAEYSVYKDNSEEEETEEK